jgi:periplasmic divalent cation tolerance protein
MNEVPVVILCTAQADNGRMIAGALVERRLVACVNMTGVTSVYRWKGEICHDEEVLLIMKSTESRVREIINTIRSLHTYELPEIIVVPITGGSPDFLAWISDETRPAG